MASMTLHSAFRVSDLQRTLSLYAVIGYREIGRVELLEMTLVMLNLPGDGEVVSLELVYQQDGRELIVGNGFSHLGIKVDDIAAFIEDVTAKGLTPGEHETPASGDGLKTASSSTRKATGSKSCNGRPDTSTG